MPRDKFWADGADRQIVMTEMWYLAGLDLDRDQGMKWMKWGRVGIERGSGEILAYG